jgi:CRISPR-associated endoribonuclease Cas6
MRFQITLLIEPSERGKILPINYQYELSSWIYKVLNEGDPIFSAWLHSHGYKTKEKPFRLFTFSRLFIEKIKVKGDRLMVLSNKAKLIISFLPDEIITPFILGLFKDRHLVLGDNFTQVAFDVSTVENLKPVKFEDEMTFSTISPLFVDFLESGVKNKKHLSPNAENYSQIVSINLREKFRAFNGKEPDPEWEDVKIIPLDVPKPKTITIKTGTPQQTQIKAYNYNFKITGAPELIKVGYYGGFGGLNSQGFGCVERIKK